MRWLLGLLLWSVAVPAQARWLEAETPHFRVYSEGSEGKLREFALLLEDYDALLRDLTGTRTEPSPNKLRVYLVRGSGQLRQIRDVSSDVAGFYHAAPGGIAAFAIRHDTPGPFGLESEDVLFHEYAHHFMLQYFPYSYPAWYAEGFAEYLMTAEFRPDRVEVGHFAANRAYGLVNRPWLPADKFFTGRPGEFRGEHAALFYGQAWLAVHYINRTPGKPQALRAYLRDIGAGTPAAQAFQAAFGTDFEGFQKELRRYLKGRMTYSALARTGSASPPIDIRRLPPSADDLLLPLAHLQAGVGKRWAPERLAQVRRDAARFPDDAFAQRVLALAEAQIGDPAAAIAAADTLLGRDANDVEALFAKGWAQLALARRPTSDTERLLAQARATFVRAHKVAPTHVPTLFAYAAAQMAGRPPSKNATEVLFLANSLAPQVAQISLTAAYAALHNQRFEDAATLLKPIAYHPHGGRLAQVAAAMLEAANARRSVPPPMLDEDDQLGR